MCQSFELYTWEFRAFDMHAKNVKTWEHSTNGCFLFHFYFSLFSASDFSLSRMYKTIKKNAFEENCIWIYVLMLVFAALACILPVFTFWKKYYGEQNKNGNHMCASSPTIAVSSRWSRVERRVRQTDADRLKFTCEYAMAKLFSYDRDGKKREKGKFKS